MRANGNQTFPLVTRKQIRHAVVFALKGKIPQTGSRIYSSRVRSLYEQEFPSITVFTSTEPISIFNDAPRTYERKLSVIIDITADADDLLDDLLDDISERVEYLMNQDYTLGGLTNDCILESSEMSLQKDGETLIGACRLIYQTPYFSEATKDPRYLENLNEVDMKIQMPTDPVSGQIDSEDLIDLTGG